MTTLDNGIVVDESLTAQNQTSAANVPAVFGQARVVTSITQHHWGELGQDFDAVTSGLAGNNARQVSAHFTAMDGRVSCLVSPDDAAWHAGNAVGNATSIGIEMRPEATDGDYETAASLIRHLRGIYGDIPLVPHNHWFNTACPGVWDLARLDSLARGSIMAAASGPITPAEDEDMPISHEDKVDIAKEVLNYIVPRNGGGSVALAWQIAAAAQSNEELVKTILNGVADIVKAGPSVDATAVQTALDSAFSKASIVFKADPAAGA